MRGRTKDISKKLLVFLLCLMTVASYSLPTGFGVNGLGAEEAHAAGPSIQASIVDDSGDPVDFSSGTAGRQEKAELTQPDSYHDTKTVVVNVGVSGMTAQGSGGTYNLDKRLKIELADGLFWAEDGTEGLIKAGTIGNAGDVIKEANHQVAATNVGGASRTYKILDNQEGCSFSITFTTSVRYGLLAQHYSEAIKISYSENGSELVNTKLESLDIKGTGTDNYALTGTYKQALDIGRDDLGATLANVPRYYKYGANYIAKGTINIQLTGTNAANAVFQPPGYLNAYFDDSDAANGKYKINFNDWTRLSIDSQTSPSICYSILFPSLQGFADGNSITVKFDVDLEYYHSETANRVRFKKTGLTHTWNVTDVPAALQLQNVDYSNITATKQSGISGQLGAFYIKNSGTQASDDKTIEMKFDSSVIGVQGFTVINPSQETKSYTITTVKNKTPKTVAVPYMPWCYSTHPIYGYLSQVTYKQLGIAKNDYITSVKYDTKIPANLTPTVYALPPDDYQFMTYHLQNMPGYFGVVLNDSKTARSTIEIYDKGKSSGDQSSTGTYATTTKTVPTFLAAVGSQGAANPTIYSGSKQCVYFELTSNNGKGPGLAYHPVLYYVVTTKDENGNYLRLEDFRQRNRNTGKIIKNITGVEERTVTNLGRVYKIDLERCGIYYPNLKGNGNQTTNVIASYNHGEIVDGVIGAYPNNKGGEDTSTISWDIIANLVTTPGTPEQEQAFDTMLYVEDRYFKDNTPLNDYYAFNTISAGAPAGVSDRTYPGGGKYAIGHFDSNKTYGASKYTIKAAKDFKVTTSAKHHDSDQYITWDEGDDPIAIGNKNSFDIKVDVTNSSDSAIPGPAYIYIPIPKKNDDWGSMMYADASGVKKPFEFNVKLKSEVVASGKVGLLGSGDYKVEYGNVVPTDDGDTLNNYAWRENPTQDQLAVANCVRITLQNLRQNPSGVPDVYTFNLECTTGNNVTDEGLVDTFAPRYYKAVPGATSWTNGSYTSLETALGEVRGQFFEDKNRNGKFDSGEALSQNNVQVTLKDKSGAEVAKEKTDSAGKYSFADIKTSEEYVINIDNPDRTKYKFTQLGTRNTKTSFTTDNQFTSQNNEANGISGAVYPKMAPATGDTPSTYNAGVIDANAKTKFIFDADGGKIGTETILTKEGTPDQNVGTITNPTKTGATFLGWYMKGDASQTLVTVPTKYGYEDKEFVAKWNIRSYNVTFTGLTGATPATIDRIQVAYGDKIKAHDDFPENPTKTGNKFLGWKVDGGAYLKASTTMPAKNVVLTADWEVKDGYIVKYDVDGGTPAVAQKTGLKWTDTVPVPAAAQQPKKEGFTFSGWMRPDGTDLASTDTYGSVAVNDTTKEITLKAKWTKKEYTVNYNTDGAPAISPKKVGWTDGNLKPANDPKKAGYTFDGWYKDAAKNNAYNGETYKELVGGNEATTSFTLYAKFTQNTYKVHYDANGGSDVASKTNVKWTDTGLISGVTTTKPGNTLDGWYTEAGVKYVNQAYSAIADNEQTASITLKARWKEVTDYAVEYKDKDGNVVSPKREGLKWTDADLAPAKDPKKAGFDFDGWYTDQQLTKSYNKGAYSTLVANDQVKTATLYAKWTQVSYKVIYDTDGGSAITPNPKTGVKWTDGASVIKPATNPTKKGSTFNKWITESGAEYTNQTYATLAGNDDSVKSVKLKATYTAKNYTVKYETNGGTPKPADKTVKWDKENLAQVTEPKKDGFTFVGWYTDQQLTKAYNDGPYSELVGDDDTKTSATLYAKWEEGTHYAVRYDFDGGEPNGVQNRANLKWNTSPLTPVPAATPKKAGYTFDGWLKPDGTLLANTDKYSDIAENDIQMYIVLKAKWEAKNYTVNYNVNGGTPQPPARTVKWDQAELTPKSEPKKEGSTFVGWYTDDKLTKLYNDGPYSELVGGDDTKTSATLFAKWETKKYSVKYDVNGGTPASIANKANALWTDAGLLPTQTVTKKGHTLDGWYTEAGEKVTATHKYSDLAADDQEKFIILKARWTARTDYKVKYNVDGGSAVPDRTGVKWEDTNLIPSKAPTKDGFTFDGWYRDAAKNNAYNGEAYSVLAGDNDNVTEVTLYAAWKGVEFTVGFEPNTMDIAGDDLMMPVKGDMYDVDVVYSSGQKAPECEYKAAGYTFKGWNTRKDGNTAKGGIAVADKGDISRLTTKAGKRVVLYAQWEANKYRIKYETQNDKPVDPADPTGTKLKVTPATYPDYFPVLWWTDKLTDNKQTDAEKNPSMQEPVEDHSVFGGWYLDDATFAKKYDGGAYSTIVANDKVMSATLYAKWIEITYKTVTSGGAEITPDPAFNRANRPSIGDEITDTAGKWFIIKNIAKPDPITGIVIITVDPITYDFVEGAGQVYTKASNVTGNFRVVRSVNDQKTFGNFKEVKVDGVTIDPANYTKQEGSVKFAFTVDFMESLAVGGHSIEAIFTDGTAQTTFAVAKAATKRTFSHLRAKGTSKSKKSVTVSWLKYKGAVKYEVYGNLCNHKGKEYKYRYLKKAGANTSKVTFKSIHGKKVKKGRYYKFYVKAYDKYGNVVAISKTVHVATKGGKYGNYKSVKLMKPKKAALSLKKGKTYKIKAKELRGNKKVDRHINIQYESTNTKVATVTKAGKIKAKSKGSCNIFVYAQNGVYKKIKLTVK